LIRYIFQLIILTANGTGENFFVWTGSPPIAPGVAQSDPRFETPATREGDLYLKMVLGFFLLWRQVTGNIQNKLRAGFFVRKPRALHEART
jgi:hypothetical protein